jgi:hypothetical protein
MRHKDNKKPRSGESRRILAIPRFFRISWNEYMPGWERQVFQTKGDLPSSRELRLAGCGSLCDSHV